jgi:hypothetical protein
METEIEKTQKIKVALASVNPWEEQVVWKGKRQMKAFICRFCQHEYERRQDGAGPENHHEAECPWLVAFLEVGRPEGLK